MIEHVQKYFLHDEPTSKLLGYSDQYGREMGEIAKKMLADDLSFLAEEVETGEVFIPSNSCDLFSLSWIHKFFLETKVLDFFEFPRLQLYE